MHLSIIILSIFVGAESRIVKTYVKNRYYGKACYFVDVEGYLLGV